MAAWPHGRTQNAPAVNQPFSSNKAPLLKNNRALLENRWPLLKSKFRQNSRQSQTTPITPLLEIWVIIYPNTKGTLV